MSIPKLWVKKYKDKREFCKISRLIEKELQKKKKTMGKNHQKTLILGTGGLEQSTFLKQMKILHGGGFSQKEKEECGQESLDDFIHNHVSENNMSKTYHWSQGQTCVSSRAVYQGTVVHVDKPVWAVEQDTRGQFYIWTAAAASSTTFCTGNFHLFKII